MIEASVSLVSFQLVEVEMLAQKLAIQRFDTTTRGNEYM